MTYQNDKITIILRVYYLIDDISTKERNQVKEMIFINRLTLG